MKYRQGQGRNFRMVVETKAARLLHKFPQRHVCTSVIFSTFVGILIGSWLTNKGIDGGAYQWAQQGREQGDRPSLRQDWIVESPFHNRGPGINQSQQAQQGRFQYEPTWESLDSRPLPPWYDDGKFGIFIHWGVFSVPSFSSEWIWYDWLVRKKRRIETFMERNFKPNVSYVDFAPEFTARFFNASEWAEILASSGAKYVVLTSKHHEGYTLWPSKYSRSWNALDVGPQRDVLGELTEAVRSQTNMTLGFYYSLYEWFHPLYLQDRKNNYQTQEYVESVMLPELHELVNMYHPEVVWGDGDWETDSSYWKAREFLAWLYNESPVRDTVVSNDRWGPDVRCHHSGFLTCDDRWHPGKILEYKWENCMTIDYKSWGYRRESTLKYYMDIEEIIKTLVSTVSCNGNLLMNIGPTHDGIIMPIFQERLQQIGDWLQVNGEAIFSTRPWRIQHDTLNTDVWYTKKTNKNKTVVYAITLKWPESGVVELAAPIVHPDTTVSMLGVSKNPIWSRSDSKIDVVLPLLNPIEMPCKWAWVLKLENVD